MKHIKFWEIPQSLAVFGLQDCEIYSDGNIAVFFAVWLIHGRMETMTSIANKAAFDLVEQHGDEISFCPEAVISALNAANEAWSLIRDASRKSGVAEIDVEFKYVGRNYDDPSDALDVIVCTDFGPFSAERMPVEHIGLCVMSDAEFNYHLLSRSRNSVISSLESDISIVIDSDNKCLYIDFRSKECRSASIDKYVNNPRQMDSERLSARILLSQNGQKALVTFMPDIGVAVGAPSGIVKAGHKAAAEIAAKALEQYQWEFVAYDDNNLPYLEFGFPYAAWMLYSSAISAAISSIFNENETRIALFVDSDDDIDGALPYAIAAKRKGIGVILYSSDERVAERAKRALSAFGIVCQTLIASSDAYKRIAMRWQRGVMFVLDAALSKEEMFAAGASISHHVLVGGGLFLGGVKVHDFVEADDIFEAKKICNE